MAPLSQQNDPHPPYYIRSLYATNKTKKKLKMSSQIDSYVASFSSLSTHSDFVFENRKENFLKKWAGTLENYDKGAESKNFSFISARPYSTTDPSMADCLPLKSVFASVVALEISYFFSVLANVLKKYDQIVRLLLR
jgi:hypothetical protein